MDQGKRQECQYDHAFGPFKISALHDGRMITALDSSRSSWGGKQVVGSCDVWFEPENGTPRLGWIKYLNVYKPRDRHQGLGRELVATAERAMKDHGAESSCVRSLRSAAAFYQKLGYQFKEPWYRRWLELPGGYTMCKEL